MWQQSFLESGNTEPSLDVFDLDTHQWRQQRVHGAIPWRSRCSFHAVAGNTLYLYGGSSEEGYSDSLYALNLDTFEWRLVPEGAGGANNSASGPTDGINTGRSAVVSGGLGAEGGGGGGGGVSGGSGRPSAKCLGGMVSFGDRRLVCFGGIGSDVRVSLEQGASYVANRTFGQALGHGWNNALHEYDIETGR